MLHAFNIILICGCSNVDVEEITCLGWDEWMRLKIYLIMGKVLF